MNCFMMVQGASQTVSEMAGQDDGIPGSHESCIQSLNLGMDDQDVNSNMKLQDPSTSLGGDDDDDDEDDDEDEERDASWKNEACLLCGKPNDDFPDLEAKPRGKTEPYLCACCSQRFELIQQAGLGCEGDEATVEGEKISLDGDEDSDGDDAEADMKPIVSLEEADEELEVRRDDPRRRRGRRAAARGLLECTECRESFQDPASLERHAMMHLVAGDCDRDRPFKCEVCLRGFNRKDKLKLHLMIHRGDKPLKCDICAKAFLRRDHLKNHVKTHSKPKAEAKHGLKQARRDAELPGDAHPHRPFACDVCHKMFSRKDNLAAHTRIHTGEKPFGCDLCGKCFAEKCALKRHMVVHTQEKLYTCRVCGRAFARKGHLTEHVWLHDEVKPFLCNVCGKAFARDRKLKSHMMTHSGERPFKCDVCERAFARKDNLKSHLSLHYGVKPARAPRLRSADQDAAVAIPDIGDALPMPVAMTTAPMSQQQQLLLGHTLMNPMGHVGLGSVSMATTGMGMTSSGISMTSAGMGLGVGAGLATHGVGMGLVPS